MAVGDDLDGGVDALGDVEVGGNGDALPAEVPWTLLVDGGLQLDVEGLAWAVADGQEDGHQVLGMAELHGQRD
jgi:hypothetical protein